MFVTECRSPAFTFGPRISLHARDARAWRLRQNKHAAKPCSSATQVAAWKLKDIARTALPAVSLLD
jgi:hypothetical protein